MTDLATALHTPLGAWMQRAACKGHSDVMFAVPIRAGHKAAADAYDAAAALCADCPVRRQCEDYYLTADCAEDSGFAAGMTPPELRQRRRTLSAAEHERRRRRLREAL